jgi:hypothetical protein
VESKRLPCSVNALDLDVNPVARAHTRASQTAVTSEGALGRVLLWTLVVPTILFLVSNPLGWLLLFVLCLAAAVGFGFGAIL